MITGKADEKKGIKSRKRKQRKKETGGGGGKKEKVFQSQLTKFFKKWENISAKK